MQKSAETISDVITSGLCIGCGLCEAVTGGRVAMEMTDYGALRPAGVDNLTEEEEAILLAVCPGTVAMSRPLTSENLDDIWGTYSTMRYAWAGDDDVRYKAATGGVLTALGMHLLDTGTVNFVLQVRARQDAPMRSEWVMSETPDEVKKSTGSRYGPTAPLAGFVKALERKQPFAIIAKPCDIGAVHAFSKIDPRVNEYCVARMVMVCGGQSRLTKSQALLTEFEVAEESLSTFRYRGYGNPGLTTIETEGGCTFQKTYNELWEDEGSWELETRCKLCPDALGEAADIAAADVWPGGGPTGEDEGFNGIIVRSDAGEELVRSAAEAKALTLGDFISPDAFNDFQPHQVRKKHAADARYQGMAEAGLPTIHSDGLRLEELGRNLSSNDRKRQIEGVKTRIEAGRFQEPLPIKGEA